MDLRPPVPRRSIMAGEIVRKSGLTAAWVKSARPKDKPYKLSDRDGLYLLIKPTGTRYWRMNYRFNGQQRTISFGRWPEITLAEAREMLVGARRSLAKDIDPIEQAKLNEIAKSIAAPNTFQSIAEEWLDKIEKEGVAAMTLKKHAGYWQRPSRRLASGQYPKFRLTSCSSS